jgi:lipoyl(octanoyl) transferase
MQNEVVLQNGRTGPLLRPGADALDAMWLDRVPYDRAWDLQREMFFARLDGDRRDSILLLEHPHTYTLGKRSQPGDLVYDEETRLVKGIAVHEVDRGGRATYHGPGQLVGYPIMALGERYDVMRYLRKLEEVLIRTAAEMGVEARRDPDHTGVWVGRNKLGAIGVKITRGITMHGFAFNVNTDLSMFEGIVPCGLRDRWVTSVAAEAGSAPTVHRAATIAAAHVADVFDRALVWTNPALDASMEEPVHG